MLRSLFILVLSALGLVACSGAGNGPAFYAEENPALLSEWGVFDVSSGALVLGDDVVPYDLNTPLFTDYAHKLRTIWVPGEAGAAAYRVGDYPDFPVGTVISKTFYYPRGDAAGAVLKAEDVDGQMSPLLQDLGSVHLIETRLLVRRGGGWEAVSYVWNDAQSDAALTRIGDAQALTLVDAGGTRQDFTYVVPNINQCAGCHAPNNTTRDLAPLGVRPRHLNKDYRHDGADQNQLEHLEAVGYLSGLGVADAAARNADWGNVSLSLNGRARAYLDINCSHCHNPKGPADTSGLDLTMEAATGPALGLCKLPIAAGAGTGGLAYDIVPGAPDDSILLHRMKITDPGAMMPELGRSLVHDEGAELIREWISGLEGACSE